MAFKRQWYSILQRTDNFWYVHYGKLSIFPLFSAKVYLLVLQLIRGHPSTDFLWLKEGSTLCWQRNFPAPPKKMIIVPAKPLLDLLSLIITQDTWDLNQMDWRTVKSVVWSGGAAGVSRALSTVEDEEDVEHLLQTDSKSSVFSIMTSWSVASCGPQRVRGEKSKWDRESRSSYIDKHA